MGLYASRLMERRAALVHQVRAINKEIERLDERLQESAEAETRMGPDSRFCDHRHYRPDEHGRRCTCGTLMWDAGD